MTLLAFAPTFRARVLLALMLPILAWSSSSDGSENVVTARSVPLNTERTTMTRLGALTYRGGLILRSRDEHFGGLSSLLIDADGKQMLAASDRGHWFSATLLYDDKGNLSGLEAGHIAPMRLDFDEDAGKAKRDAESLAIDENGSIIVGFEHNHRLLRLPANSRDTLDSTRLGQTTTNANLRLPGLHRLPRNSGLEALVTVRDGRLLAIAEGRKNAEPSPA